MVKQMKRMFNTRDVLALTGVTHRQLYYWINTKLIKPHELAVGSGYQHLLDMDNVVDIRSIKRLLDFGFQLASVREWWSLDLLDAPLQSMNTSQVIMVDVLGGVRDEALSRLRAYDSLTQMGVSGQLSRRALSAAIEKALEQRELEQ